MDWASVFATVITAVLFGLIIVFVRSTTTGTIEVIAESGGANNIRRTVIGPTVTGVWHGHNAEWKFRGGSLGHRCVVSIAVDAEVDVVVRPRGTLNKLDIAGPPTVQVAGYPDISIRSTDAAFAERILGAASVRESIGEALTDGRDVLRIGRTSIEVTRTVGDIDDRPMALMKAQALAMAVCEELSALRERSP